MPARQPSELYATWSSEQSPVLIEYDLRVLEDIRFLVVDGFNKVPHGGLEVGGVLFGTREGSSVRISAFRELEIEHRSGPSFTLSERDEAELQKLLRLPEEDPDLAGTEAVGWAHSHTRSGIQFSAADLTLHERYFPEPWQIALVLKPFKWDPTRAAFFTRATGGAIGTPAATEEFEIRPLREPTVSEDREVAADADEDVEVIPAVPSLSVPAVSPEVVLVPTPDLRVFAPVQRPLRRRRMAWGIAAGVAVMLAVAAGAASLLRLKSDESPFRVQLADQNGQLLISWDRTAAEVERAKSAQLVIHDGEQGIALELTPAQVRRGSVTYVRNSGSVSIRFRIQPQDGPVVEELARFIGPPTQRLAAQAPPKIESPPINVSAPGKPPFLQEPQTTAERADVPDEPAPQPTKESAKDVPKRFRPPVNAHRTGGGPVLLSDAPQIVAADSGQGLALPGVRAPRLPAPQPPAPQAATRAPEPPAPRSGRVIWTGQLKRGQYLAIDGTQSSTGFVTGQLPQVPVRIRVFPADLTEDGIHLYTSDSALRGRTEVPAAQNGWNRTRFLMDPKLAGGVQVVESPAPSNGWKRVVLQNSVRDEAAIVIQWQAM